ncbi:MAG: hypothetical protein JXP34_28130 [Planctomycetes bacterium]|nr:hypothetical protein [Planctomycetota bacterium]
MGALALAIGLLAAAPAAPPVFLVVDGAAGKAAHGDRWPEVLAAAKALAGGDAARILDAGEIEKQALRLRDWLAHRVPPGATIVLLGDEQVMPTWKVRVANVALTTDALYGDLDGDGVPDTAVARLPDRPEALRRPAAKGKGAGGKAVILCSEDTRIHLETRAFLLALSDLGYDVAVRGVRDDAVLAASDLIVHFGHGSPSGLFNRFGEVFVDAGSVPRLPRAPLVFVDGCGTLPVASPLLRAFLERGAAAYAGSTATVLGMTPARFTNELVEHFLRALAEAPDAPIPRILMAARAAYVRGHAHLAERLRDLAATGALAIGGDDAHDVLTVIEWVCHGDPRAAIRRAGPARAPCRRALRLYGPIELEGEGASWQASYDSKADDGRTVLAIHADIPLAERRVFRLAVRQNDGEIAVLDGLRDTVYQRLGEDCRGGYVSGETYRARFLIPLRSGTGQQRIEIAIVRGIRATLAEGTEIDVWPPDFEKMIGLRSGPVAPGRSGTRTPVKTEGKAALKAAGEDGFLALDLSSVFNSRHGSTRVGGGDNASFATWFAEDAVKAGDIPFIVKRTGDDVLVSANNTQNVFEIAGFETRARAVHLLVWAYSLPRRPARLALVFADGAAQAFEVPLVEWTEGRPGFAFDFRNTVAGFRHAAIYRHSIPVESPEKQLVGVRSESGTYGLVAITIETAR